MTNLETTFTDISGWHKNVHYSTGGTRSKKIVINPITNGEYFFKGSKINKINGETLYPTEFWSEIVSSKIGQLLGFNMLDYNIAYDENDKQKIGCISKSMVLNSQNKLTEGVYYLTGFNPSYIPTAHKSDYTYQFICNALREFSLFNYMPNIIEIIVFDSVVGNSDRHQENWGIITYYQDTLDKLQSDIERNEPSFLGKFRNIYLKALKKVFVIKMEENFKLSKSFLTTQTIFPNQFAPIYDSGCCLGREREDNWVEKAINDIQMIEKYVSKGESEIHWEGFQNKRKHFELIELLISKHSMLINPFLEMVKIKYNPDEIKIIINNIDAHLPSNLDAFKLSNNRKELMFKLVTLRIEKLIKYL